MNGFKKYRLKSHSGRVNLVASIIFISLAFVGLTHSAEAGVLAGLGDGAEVFDYGSCIDLGHGGSKMICQLKVSMEKALSGDTFRNFTDQVYYIFLFLTGFALLQIFVKESPPNWAKKFIELTARFAICLFFAFPYKVGFQSGLQTPVQKVYRSLEEIGVGIVDLSAKSAFGDAKVTNKGMAQIISGYLAVGNMFWMGDERELYDSKGRLIACSSLQEDFGILFTKRPNGFFSIAQADCIEDIIDHAVDTGGQQGAKMLTASLPSGLSSIYNQQNGFGGFSRDQIVRALRDESAEPRLDGLRLTAASKYALWQWLRADSRIRQLLPKAIAILPEYGELTVVSTPQAIRTLSWQVDSMFVPVSLEGGAEYWVSTVLIWLLRLVILCGILLIGGAFLLMVLGPTLVIPIGLALYQVFFITGVFEGRLKMLIKNGLLTFVPFALWPATFVLLSSFLVGIIKAMPASVSSMDYRLSTVAISALALIFMFIVTLYSFKILSKSRDWTKSFIEGNLSPLLDKVLDWAGLWSSIMYGTLGAVLLAFAPALLPQLLKKSGESGAGSGGGSGAGSGGGSTPGLDGGDVGDKKMGDKKPGDKKIGDKKMGITGPDDSGDGGGPSTPPPVEMPTNNTRRSTESLSLNELVDKKKSIVTGERQRAAKSAFADMDDSAIEAQLSTLQSKQESAKTRRKHLMAEKRKNPNAIPEELRQEESAIIKSMTDREAEIDGLRAEAKARSDFKSNESRLDELIDQRRQSQSSVIADGTSMGIQMANKELGRREPEEPDHGEEPQANYMDETLLSPPPSPPEEPDHGEEPETAYRGDTPLPPLPPEPAPKERAMRKLSRTAWKYIPDGAGWIYSNVKKEINTGLNTAAGGDISKIANLPLKPLERKSKSAVDKVRKSLKPEGKTVTEGEYRKWLDSYRQMVAGNRLWRAANKKTQKELYSLQKKASALSKRCEGLSSQLKGLMSEKAMILSGRGDYDEAERSTIIEGLEMQISNIENEISSDLASSEKLAKEIDQLQEQVDLALDQEIDVTKHEAEYAKRLRRLKKQMGRQDGVLESDSSN